MRRPDLVVGASGGGCGGGCSAFGGFVPETKPHSLLARGGAIPARQPIGPPPGVAHRSADLPVIDEQVRGGGALVVLAADGDGVPEDRALMLVQAGGTVAQ